jgi:hypothetical protein
MLAAGGHQGVVDLYRVGAEDGGAWQRVARCSGHSSTILHMDWGYSAAALGAVAGEGEAEGEDGSPARAAAEARRRDLLVLQTSAACLDEGLPPLCLSNSRLYGESL